MPQRGLGCSVSLTGESASTCGRGTGLDESDSMRATTGTAPNRAIVPRAESENRPTASNFALSASRLIDAILPEISIPSQVYMFVNFFVKRCLGLITFGNYAPRCRQALGKNVPLVATGCYWLPGWLPGWLPIVPNHQLLIIRKIPATGLDGAIQSPDPFLLGS